MIVLNIVEKDAILRNLRSLKEAAAMLAKRHEEFPSGQGLRAKASNSVTIQAVRTLRWSLSVGRWLFSEDG